MGREAEIRKYLAANFPDIKLRANMTYKQLLRIAQRQAGVLPASFSTEGLTEGRNPASEAAEALIEDLPSEEQAVPSGGTDGQVLTKLSGGDYDMGWITPSATGGGSGSVTSVGVVNGGGLTVSGSPITTAGDITLSLENSGVVAGAYTNANITVDNFGRITVAANGSAGGGTIGGSIADTQIAVGSGTDTIGGSNGFTFIGNAMTITTGSSDAPKIQMAYESGAVTMQVTNPNELQLSDGTDDGGGPGTALRFSSGLYSAVTNPGFGQVKLSANHTTKTGGFNAGILQLTTETGYLRFGPQNTSFCHFYTDRTYFYFNKPIQFDGGSLFAYNDDFEIKTDDSGSGQPTRIFIDAGVDECRIGLGNGFTQLNLPATECHVNGTIRQTAVTNAVVGATVNGDLVAVTIGAGLDFTAGTLSATGGGGGGGSGPVIGSIGVDTGAVATFAYPGGTTDLTVVLTGVQDIDTLGPFIIPTPPAGHLYLNLIGQGLGTSEERGYIVQFDDAYIPGVPGSPGIMGNIVPFGNARFAWDGTNWLPIANGNWRRGAGFEDFN